jgi:hypothetical protein
MAETAERYGYDMIGIADTPGSSVATTVGPGGNPPLTPTDPGSDGPRRPNCHGPRLGYGLC